MYFKPVYISDTIYTEVTITVKAEYKKPAYGSVTEHVEVINQHGAVVLVCDHLLLVARREHVQE